MKKEVSKALIGAFILGAVILAVIAVLVFGSGSFFQDSERYVMHFTGSVKGLNTGAPVQLKGVPIGKVISINLEYSPTDESFFTQVIVEVPTGSVKIIGETDMGNPENSRLATEATIDFLIKIGFRAKLVLQSFVTGQLLVAFDFYPDTPVNLMGFNDDLQELPTLPSDMEALTKTFESIDFPAVAESISNAAKGIDELANSPELHEAVVSLHETMKRYGQLASNLDGHAARLSDETAATLADVRQLIATTDSQIPPMTTGITDTAAEIKKTARNLDRRFQPVLENLEATTANARNAFQQAEAMLDNLTHLSDEGSAFIYRIEETMSELKKAATALAVLADYLSRHPEAILQGKQAAQEK